MSRVYRFWIALLLSLFTGFPADTAPQKALFVVRVEGLKSIPKDEKPAPANKEAATKGEAENPPAEFALESGTAEGAVEARAQQIQGMNGTPLLRRGSGPGPRAATGVGRAFDFLFPRGKPLLSKNPNARRDPLRILEE